MLSRTPKGHSSRPVLNALLVLEMLADAEGELTLSEISRRCGLPKATTLRYLAAFEQAGYVARAAGDGKYSLGSRIVALSRKFYGSEGLLTIARGKLPELAKATEETAHIALLRFPDVVYVDIAESPQRVRAIVPRGEQLPAYCVASGRAILSCSDRTLIDSILSAGLKPRTKFTIVKPAAFLAELKRVAKQGYAANVGEWMEDVVGVSAPLFSPDGRAFAAVGVSLPMSRANLKGIKSLGEIVRSFARGLSTDFGSH